MTEGDDPPCEWERIEPNFPQFQEDAWRFPATNEVLIIESKREPWHDDDELPDLSVVLVKDEILTEPRPVRTVLGKTKNYQEAVHKAWEFMAEASEKFKRRQNGD